MGPRLAVACLALALGSLVGAPRPARADVTSWSEWSAETFARARREGRILVVEVSAAWCHWCHVMEHETYADPRVVRRLASRFLPVKVDADARPDLAERYAEYHWPATVFLTPDAATITAIRGYRGPDDFLKLLDDVEAAAREGRTLSATDSPDGGATAVAGAEFLPALRERLAGELDATWDPVVAGWGRGQKYPYPASVLHALLRARLDADAERRDRALRTLAASERLLDPVWGGMYQYSEGGAWDRPHFEKIASVNAGALTAFASAHRLTGDVRWRKDADEVRHYLKGTLRAPSGAFYTSQDADVGVPGDAGFVEGRAYFALDDAGRRRLGIPRIDRAVYAQENGLFVEALCDAYRATGDATALAEAEAAARAILRSHRDPAGGLRHAAGDAQGLHLGDQTAFGRACVALSDATGDPAWIDEAVAIADAMLDRLLDRRRGGFFVRTDDPAAAGVFREGIRPFEGNASAARFLLALHAATGKGVYRVEALRAIAAVASPELSARFGWRCSALLLAVEEALRPWVHATLVATDGDPSAEPLWRALRELDAPLLVRERVVPGQGSTAGTTYPPSPVPAIYLCGDGRCSPAVRRAADLPSAWKAFRGG
jgi:hypothetical protein